MNTKINPGDLYRKTFGFMFCYVSIDVLIRKLVE